MKCCPHPRVRIIGFGYWDAKHVRVVQGLDRVSSAAIIHPMKNGSTHSSRAHYRFAASPTWMPRCRTSTPW